MQNILYHLIVTIGSLYKKLGLMLIIHALFQRFQFLGTLTGFNRQISVKGKTDILMENYLLYGETLEQGAERILQEILPSAPPQNLHFCFMYHFENEITNRLVYNFILDLNNDSILCNKKFKGGKLWTFQQIEHNLHRNFFSSCFEREYEHTKEIIYTREKYKEF